jgi:GABA permease
MNELEHPNHRILVIANAPCPCPMLSDEVARRALERPTDVVVVAPALNSRLRHLVSDMDEAVVQAQERLEVVVTELRDRDVSARGDVGDTNPILAIADALAYFPATEIMIATHPRGESHWLERRLIEKARARFDVPITELVSGSGVVQDGIAA